MNNKNIHFYWLDALRFIAAFTVLFGHARNDYFLMWGCLPEEQRSLAAFLFYSLGRLGHEAVVVFFVLSGFLVGGRGLERIGNKSFDSKSYMIDRFARIYPPPRHVDTNVLHNMPIYSYSNVGLGACFR